MPDPGFWQGKRVLLTGQTGFKGSWLMLWLEQLNAQVFGMALNCETTPCLFEQLFPCDASGQYLGDIRDPALVKQRIDEVEPDVILHLAAQALVLRSYRDPLEMGSAHILDALKGCKRQMAVIMVTTDKVYDNREWVHAYRETDRLGGHDPYSTSKAACELLVDSYRKSFFADSPVRIATARAGNVIGGGDWAENRIMPDIVRAIARGDDLEVRNPDAVRPWQHVLDPLAGYLCLAEKLWHDATLAEAFNFGPDPADQRPVRDLVEAAMSHWPGRWHCASASSQAHEAGHLTLSTDKARSRLKWRPRWSFSQAVGYTIDWYRANHAGACPRDLSLKQIAEFEKVLP
ncbi:CDP-glucose 4,6-dehydratase [Roseovarius sp. SCSIO 43702]|uniref:CDP-glucose 4,6-dehydratase n=1 Tax=Roseovarius sp. SCSIO 43702 TaxID=2823043 RepID=UPI001C73CA2C|nr:CDP-glucose 4,6-dehydratase [Roseovarius sp. SCSIO 43702]QYX55688.1 CDP-glucose 4,6-dehydratase [Roseovarius sp. SCSIO 43702]